MGLLGSRSLWIELLGGSQEEALGKGDEVCLPLGLTCTSECSTCVCAK